MHPIYGCYDFIKYSFKFIVNLRRFISSMILRFFQAKASPGTVHTVTMALNFCHTKTIRVFLKALNASDKVCYINPIIFHKIITSQLFLQVPPFYFSWSYISLPGRPLIWDLRSQSEAKNQYRPLTTYNPLTRTKAGIDYWLLKRFNHQTMPHALCPMPYAVTFTPCAFSYFPYSAFQLPNSWHLAFLKTCCQIKATKGLMWF